MADKRLIGAASIAVALGIGGLTGAVFGSPSVSGAVEDGSTSAATAAQDPAAGTDAPEGRFADEIEAAAGALGMDVADLRTALQEGTTVATLAEQQGVELQTVIDAIVASAQDELVDRVTAWVNGEGGPGFGGPGGHGPGGGRHPFLREGLETAATALGLSEDDLRAQLQDGATIASIAETAGIDLQTVIDAMVADADAAIDRAIADGRIDEDRATEMRANLLDRITALVNGELRPGHDGPPPGDAPAADDGTDSTTD